MTNERLSLELDGEHRSARDGQSIFDVAKEHGVRIPTLCHDPRLKPSASCWMCVVEVREGDRWVKRPSCDTRVQPGMVVRTSSDSIVSTRRWALELLLSDHYADCVAPCTMRCPAGVDIPRYVAAVARGQLAQAALVVRETNPFPGVCGRICPHPCEVACDRQHVDDTVAINRIKRLATEKAERAPLGPRGQRSGKRVAVVGAGPAGLSASWFLTLLGHDVTVLDDQGEPGGMLRYGIPSYRLPRDVLDADIEAIRAAGVRLLQNRRLGRDFTVRGLLADGADAVLLAAGAWRSREMLIDGEDAAGVLGGVAFLKSVSEGQLRSLQGRVGVVGGGNTALDAARTALRLGASEVTILYRRSREEMPAFAAELEHALEEGVRMRCLVVPAAVVVEAGRATGVRLTPMVLGAPDESGRRRPVAAGEGDFVFPLETLIVAIGETPDTALLDDEHPPLATDTGSAIDVERAEPPMREVFAAGDFRSGAGTAIEAIASGRRAAIAIDGFFTTGKAQEPVWQKVSVRAHVGTVGEADFVHIGRRERREPKTVDAAARARTFAEAELGYTEQDGRAEAARCMQCGCASFGECELRALMNEHDVDGARLAGEANHYLPEPLRPGLTLEMNKCVRCTRCVRICEEVAGVGALAMAERGFETRVIFGLAQGDGRMVACDECVAGAALCVDTCPTGALSVSLEVNARWGRDKGACVVDLLAKGGR